jgi:hypothetical protein
MDTLNSERTGVRVLAWGATQEELEHALREVEWHPARRFWEVGEPETSVGASCPIDVNDPNRVTADRGFGWAYAVYPVRRA